MAPALSHAATASPNRPGQVTRLLALPIDPLADRLADLGRAVPLAQFGEQSAPLDAGELAIVAGEDQLRARCLRRGQQFDGDAAVQHRRLVDDDDDGLGVPLRAAVLQPEELGVHRARLGETVCLEILRNRVGRRQSDHAASIQRVRVADRSQDKTLASAGTASMSVRLPGPIARSNAAR
jgi:hypothetical protein